jgi:transcriptional regulator with XRE-family HTH domain
VSLFLGTDGIKQYFRYNVKHCLSYSHPSENQAMLDSKEIGRRIKLAMDEVNLTGADLAEACKVTPQAVSGWRSTGRVGKRHLTTISRLTGKAMEYFLSETVPNGTRNGGPQPWLIEKVIDPDQFQIVFRTWQDARLTDRQSLVAVAKTARKAHGTRRRKRAS